MRIKYIHLVLSELCIVHTSIHKVLHNNQAPLCFSACWLTSLCKIMMTQFLFFFCLLSLLNGSWNTEDALIFAGKVWVLGDLKLCFLLPETGRKQSDEKNKAFYFCLCNLSVTLLCGGKVKKLFLYSCAICLK